MQTLLSRTFILFLPCLLVCSTTGAASLAIVNGTVIDGAGNAPLKNAVIVIDGDRVAIRET